MRSSTPNRPFLLALLMLIAVIAPPQTSAFITQAYADTAQNAPEPGSDEAHPMEPDSSRLKLGDACQRKTDNIPGKVKRDGCGRWYCGRADIKDIVELIPNVDKVANCTWRLQGNRCLCAKNGSSN